MNRVHRWKASAFLPVLRAAAAVPGSAIRSRSVEVLPLFHAATAEGGRLNSFGAIGHHQDVIFFLLTVFCLSSSSFHFCFGLHGQ